MSNVKDSLERVFVTRHGYRHEALVTVDVNTLRLKRLSGALDLSGVWILHQSTGARFFSIAAYCDRSDYTLARIEGPLSEHHILCQVADHLRLHGFSVGIIQDADFGLVII